MFLQINDLDQIRDKINQYTANGVEFFFAVNYELSEAIFVDKPMEQSQLMFCFNGKGNKPSKEFASSASSKLEVFPNGLECYRSKFDIAYKELAQGTIKVMNLTERTPINFNMSCKEIFMNSNSPYQIYFPEHFVCFSPERFVHISSDGTISTNPMKGTIDASLPNAERQIIENQKEQEEHRAIVQLSMDELSEVATDVHISKFRYIDRIESHHRNLLQVSSEVVGKLKADAQSQMGDVLFKLLPAASISGSPRKEAIDIIARAEDVSRGYYCGIGGYFDGRDLDTAVLIRYIEVEGEKHYFRSGGGITVKSNCEQEYQEVLDKIYLPF